jgi:conjugative transposon TraN protein
MKRKCVFVIAVMFSLFTQKSFSQSSKFSFIPSAHLTVTYNKTTNLIFPFTVQSIDRGSKDILVQQPKGTENIVQVKADKPNFTQTNLSVITIDGKLYSFTVDYSSQPNQLNIIIGRDDSAFNSSNAPVALFIGYNEALIKAVCKKIVEAKGKHEKTDKNNEMKLQLKGIYINHDVLYFRLQLQNKSNVSYDADNISFTIKDKQKEKRTATQEMNLTPVYSYNAFTKVEADSSATCVIALPKFTLPDSKYLSIQILEKNGGRNLNINLKSRQIMKAASFNITKENMN